mgnify:CR=1 FL=1
MPTWPRTTSHKTGGNAATPVRKKVSRREKTLRSIYHDDNGDVPPMRTMERRSGRGTSIIVGLFVLLLLTAGVVIWRKEGSAIFARKTTKNTTIELAVKGDAEASVLTPYAFTITVNPGTTGVKEANLSLFLPNGFELKKTEPEFSETPSAKERAWRLTPDEFKKGPTLTIEGVFLGNIAEQKTFRAVLTYTPRNFESEFQTNTIHTVLLASSPVAFTVNASESIRGGEPVTFTANIKNGGPEKLMNLAIRPPTHRSFALSDDPTVLKIADLDVNTQLTRDLHGSFSSDMEGTTALTWELVMTKEGADHIIAQTANTVAVAPQPLILSIALENNPEIISPGDILKGEVRYHNKSARPIEKAKITLSIDAPAKKRNSIFEWDKLEATGSPKVEGVPQSDTVRRGVITWASDAIPTLETIAPNQQGIFSFSLPIKTSEKFDYTPVGAAQIVLNLEATSGEEKATAQPITLSLAADTRITAGAAKTGETVTLQWTISHHFHNLASVKVAANLFGTIEWLNQTDESDGTITYDPIRRTVTWDIPAFAATEGVATANFAVKITQTDPTQTAIMSVTVLTATDDTLARSITRKATEVKIPR